MDAKAGNEVEAVSVVALNNTVSSISDRDELFRLFRDTDWSNVEGPPTHWFNIGTHYSQFDLEDEADAIYQAGMQQHPDSVDLRCAAFQHHYGVDTNMEAAQKDWDALKTMAERTTSWRYYVYGARFLAISGQNGAQALLEEGITTVPTRDLANLYVALSEQSHYEPLVSQDHVDEMLRKGVESPIRLGHLVALALSKRTQRRSGAQADPNKRRMLLSQALDYSNLALSLYLDPGERNNHPIEEVYYQQAHVLVALERYGEALARLRTVERSADNGVRRKPWYPTVRPTRVFCEQMTGEMEATPTVEAALAAVAAAEPAEIVECARRHPEAMHKLLMLFVQQKGGSDE